MSYANVITGEVTKLLKNESHMFVIGYLESVLATAMEMMPKEQADRMMQVYFYDRPIPVNIN